MDYDKDFEDSLIGTSLGKIFCKHHKGNGKSVLFLHGLGATTKVWTRLVNYLPEDLNIYLMDLLGHGKSDAPQIDYTVAKQVQVLKEVINALNLEDFYVFGHSYGGWITLGYVLRGGKSSGYIFEDVAGSKDYFEDMRKNPIKFEERRERILQELSYLNSSRTWVFDNILAHSSDNHEFTHAELNSITEPTLIIWGSDDDIIDLAVGKEMREYIPNSQLKVIDGAKHVPHYSNPQEVAEYVSEFLGY